MDELIIDLERGKCSSSKPTRLEGTAPFTQSLLLNSRMPVEDPKALAQTYLAKHNVEKIFEVR